MTDIRKLAPFSVLMAALLGGCVVAPAPYYGYDDGYDSAVIVNTAPPAPRVEYRGEPPVVGYLWIDGFWSWSGRRYEWRRGHWEAPRRGYVWQPQRWERDGDRWRSSGGRWERNDRNDRNDYRHDNRRDSRRDNPRDNDFDQRN